MQLVTLYPWLKAIHIAFMVTWFAGLFYLPRLFIYHAEASDEISRTRFIVMERRLFAIMTLGAIITLVFGVLLIGARPTVFSEGWFHAKLTLLLGLTVFHLLCWRWMGKLEAGYSADKTTNLRWFNEIPVFFLLAIIALAVVKPF